jgi:thioredoxin reductase (NADPH)
MKKIHHKLVIIGSGPAGLTAAIYAGRAALPPIVVEGLMRGGPPGGQLTQTTDVENYPGFPKGIMGPEMMAAFREQAERFGTQFVAGDVEKVELRERPFKLTISGVEDVELTCDALVIATGAVAKWLGLPSEEKLKGQGVSACATCDGFFFRGQHVAVIGGGDTAMEEATFLTKHAASVTIVHRRAELRASKIMQERAKKNPKISWKLGYVVDEFLGEPGPGGGCKGLRITNPETGATEVLPTTGVFVAIGHQPNSDLFKGMLQTDESGYIKLAGDHHAQTATEIPGVFACGDVVDHVYRQAVSAAGTGCMAAIDAERYLSAVAG